MASTELLEPVFFARPSLRRGYFYAFLYAGFVAYGRTKIDLSDVVIGPGYDPIMLALTLLLSLLALAHLNSWCTSYVITGQDVRATSGILARRMAVVPYKRITNVAARQSFLERLLGLANLYVDTAGSDRSEVIFQRITRSDARAAAAILNRIVAERSSPQ